MSSFFLGVVCAAIFLVALPVELPAQDDPMPRQEKGKKGKGGKSDGAKGPRINKPRIEETIRLNVYADNWFKLYINGNLVAVDSISFIPHNVVSVEVLPQYPMTIAVMAKDNADPETGLEYDNTNVGDGGFILKFADGTVTNSTWKARSFFQGPMNRDLQNPRTEHQPIPADWFEVDFDDHQWDHATEHSENEVKPKSPYYENDFEGAKWIWTENLALDNTVIFRTRIERPPNGAPLPPPDWPRGHIDASNR
ncbi:MAG: hypothetical protein AAGA96_18910 [Verrucomicrobiota bacterium]